jgi:hypothetical protein
MRLGKSPREAGLEVLDRIVAQTRRLALWQPALWQDGKPAFGIHFYVLGLDGGYAGVTLKGGGRFAVADAAGGARLEALEPLLS